MSSSLGVNLDATNPAGRPAVADLNQLNQPGWGRLVGFLDPASADAVDPAVIDYVAALQQAGIRCVVVLAKQSFPANADPAQWEQAASTYAQQLPADCWQIGN